MEHLPVAWDGDRLVITDPAALAKIDRPYLSPSSADAIASCPARFAIDKLLPRSVDPFGAPEIGTSGHTLLEGLYGLPNSERTLRQARNILSDMALHATDIDPLPGDPYRPMRWQANVWRKIRGLFTVENPSKVIVRAREWEMQGIEVAGVPFRGFIDRVDITSSDHGSGVAIVDYKTGKYQAAGLPWGDHHGDQIRLYVTAVKAWDGRAPIEGRLIYTGVGKQRFVSLSSREMHDTLDRFSKAWDKTQACATTGTFETRTSALCGWCPLVRTCPAAIAAGIGPHETNTSTLFVPSVGDTHEAGHMSTNNDSPESGTTTKDDIAMLREDKVWEETSKDGSLNPNSYAAIAVFGMVELAVEEMEDADVPLTKTAVSAFTETLAAIVLDVQSGITGSESWQAGTNSRVRGALHSSLKAFPAPFGGTSDDWAKWVERVTHRTSAIASVAIALWESVPDPEAWNVLAVDPDEENEDNENDDIDEATAA